MTIYKTDETTPKYKVLKPAERAIIEAVASKRRAILAVLQAEKAKAKAAK